MLSLQLMVRSPHVLACFKRLTVFSVRNTVAKRDYFAFLQENRPEPPYDEVELEEMNEEGADIEEKERGVAYVRWGRRDCPTNAELVYAGRAAGSYYGHSGGGSNYQCIVENPKNFDGFGAGTVDSSFIYGAEYEVWGNVPKASLHLHDHDVRCAVCYVADRTAKIMVPGIPTYAHASGPRSMLGTSWPNGTTTNAPPLSVWTKTQRKQLVGMQTTMEPCSTLWNLDVAVFHVHPMTSRRK